MPWAVGIDEAGYGPNLGPLVQAAVALHLPDDDPAGWDTLRGVVRRCHEPDDGRLLIDDSKKVYTRGGFEALERGVWAAFAAARHTVHEFLWGESPVPDWGADLWAESWFDADQVLPVEVPAAELAEGFGRFREAAGGCGWDVRLVPAPWFNRVCDECGSKGAVLARGLVELAAGAFAALPADGRPVVSLCDKQGGRNFYAAMVQQAFPDGWVVAEKEGAAESRYRVDRLDRPVSVVFRPRADGDSVAVALASMVCKYLREVCMRQFNRFWQQHVPDLKPTAGYPGDAKRFYDAIRPAMAKLGLTEDQVWRKR
ncbi:MAG: hypothetical protein K2X87_24915 [Gemmataceae bacterium]|nr:hypothetical protein [Gemmataceae bacterium]